MARTALLGWCLVLCAGVAGCALDDLPHPLRPDSAAADLPGAGDIPALDENVEAAVEAGGAADASDGGTAVNAPDAGDAPDVVAPDVNAFDVVDASDVVNASDVVDAAGCLDGAVTCGATCVPLTSFMTDVNNCGGCGTPCHPANAVGACVAGACTIGSCTAGFGDCDANPADGCEINTQTNSDNCGRCGNACVTPGGTPVCSVGTCGLSHCTRPMEHCVGANPLACETNLAADAMNCGTCGRGCAYPNAAATCVPTGAAAPTPPGACRLGACTTGFADCDHDPTNGCEVAVAGSDVANCGGCGAACNLAHATPACVAGACRIASCAAGFGDCDGSAANGCETSLATNDHCGACGTACVVTQACGAGTCTLTALSVAVAVSISCAVMVDTTARCWGSDNFNRLGNAGSAERDSPTTVVDAAGHPFAGVAQIAIGQFHVCALKTDGTVWCWGSGTAGQFGDGTATATRLFPGQVPGLTGVRQIAAGNSHTCALKTDGTVWCWGFNSHLQLGTMAGTDGSRPAPVVGLTSASQLSLGGTRSCALKTDGTVWCWGSGDGGLFLDSMAGDRPPTALPGLSGVAQIAVSPNFSTNHFCVRMLAGGSLRCWGANTNGQLGLGTTSTTVSTTPTMVPGLGGLSQLWLGFLTTCASGSFAPNTLRCWGANTSGQLGLGPGMTTDVSSPTQVSGLNFVVSGAASYHNCTVGNDGLVRCWGENQNGQLGLGTNDTMPHPVPTIVPIR